MSESDLRALADAVYVARGALSNDDPATAFERLDRVLRIADEVIHRPLSSSPPEGEDTQRMDGR